MITPISAIPTLTVGVFPSGVVEASCTAGALYQSAVSGIAVGLIERTHQFAEKIYSGIGGVFGEYGWLAHIYGPAAGLFAGATTAISGFALNGGLVIASAKTALGLKDIRGKGKLDEDGHLKYVVLSETQEIQNITFAAGTMVGFYKGGQLSYAALFKGHKIQGITFAAGTLVKFYEGGQLKYAILHEAQEIQGIKVATGTQVGFYKNGRLEYAKLSESQDVQGVKIPADTRVRFNEDGYLKK